MSLVSMVFMIVAITGVANGNLSNFENQNHRAPCYQNRTLTTFPINGISPCPNISANQNRSNSNTVFHPYSDPCQRSTKLQNILFACFLVFVLVIGICGNLLAIFVICSSRNLQKQVAFKFIISLAFADMGVSIFVTTIKVNMYINNGSFCHSLNLCYFTTFVDYIFPMASITHLLIIAIDRFCAITMPFKYASVFSHSKAKVVIACGWLYVFIWAGLGMFPWSANSTKLQVVLAGEGKFCYNSNINYVTTIASVIYFIPMVVSTCLYCVVLWVAMKQASTINKMKPANSHGKLNCKRGRRLKRDLRAARTISVVFAAYIICWLPHFITILIGYWDPDAIRLFSINHKLAYDSVTTIFNNILPTINSCINPFIYFLFGANFRVAFKDVLFKVLKKPRDGIHYPDDHSYYAADDRIGRVNSERMSSVVEYQNGTATSSRNSSVKL